MDERRQQRLAENQSLFRGGINQRLREGHARFALEGQQEFVCECADMTCTERMLLTIEEYEQVRSNPRRFVIVPGHEISGVEDVVEEHRDYIVVEKFGAGGEVAEREDPRHQPQ
jgi:hypothetical protein